MIKINSYAFDGCSSIQNLKFEDGSSNLDLNYGSKGGLFADSSLDSVYIGRNMSYTSGENYSDGIDCISPFAKIKTLRSVYFSDAVTSIHHSMFYECVGLESIYGMRNVESIGISDQYDSVRGCFAGCTSLKSFIIGNKVTAIGKSLFWGCTSLETLVIGDGIEDISGNSLIYGCNLKRIYLGKNIRKLGMNSLGNCIIQKVYLFSDVLTEAFYNNSTQNAIPTSVEAIYVANPKRYETLLGNHYNLRELLTFNESSLEYTGKTPELSYKNYVDDFDVSFSNEATPKDAGSYNTNIDVTFYNDKWSTTIELPCSYTITKAPLSVVANDIQRSYGEENPELKSIFVGFKNGETNDVLEKQPTLYTTATKESNAGTYPIYCSGAEARNYDITYERGTLTINKASQNITWNQDFSNVSVGDVIELTATCSSYMSVKYRSSDQSALLVTSENNKQYAYVLKPGIVALTAYQNGNNNYEEANEVSKIINIQATDIDEIHANNGNASYYDIEGRRITKPVRNRINIIRTDDGKIRKVFVK